MRFRRKPDVVDAIRYTGPDMAFQVGMFVGELLRMGRPVIGSPYWNEARECSLHTLEGPVTVHPGDWIVVGVLGELYPCAPDVFAATYERVFEEVE